MSQNGPTSATFAAHRNTATFSAHQNTATFGAHQNTATFTEVLVFPAGTFYLLLESGDAILLESGDHLLLEAAP